MHLGLPLVTVYHISWFWACSHKMNTANISLLQEKIVAFMAQYFVLRSHRKQKMGGRIQIQFVPLLCTVCCPSSHCEQSYFHLPKMLEVGIHPSGVQTSGAHAEIDSNSDISDQFGKWRECLLQLRHYEKWQVTHTTIFNLTGKVPGTEPGLRSTTWKE